MANVKSIDEQVLIDQCINEQEWAQRQLYQMYQATLFPICLRYAIDYNEAEDIFQEGFIRIFQNLKQFRKEGSFEGWLKRVMVTTALNYIKKHRKHLSMEMNTVAESAISINNTNSLIETNDIMLAFNSLPFQFRVVLNLYAIEGYGYNELSEILGIEESSCRTRVFRAKQLLQKIMIEHKIVNTSK